MTSQLQQFVARIERLEEEKKTITTDIGEIYKEAKSQGFDTKILRKTIALRKKPAAERQEEAANIDMYMSALGANVADVQTFTRKDGVKVTLERVDPITGEITEHNSGAVAASSAPDTADGEGATSPSANYSPNQPEMADAQVVLHEHNKMEADCESKAQAFEKADVAEVTSPYSESEGVSPDADTEAVEDSPDLASTADPYVVLAIPDFLRRSPPPVAPLHRVLP